MLLVVTSSVTLYIDFRAVRTGATARYSIDIARNRTVLPFAAELSWLRKLVGLDTESNFGNVLSPLSG